MASSKFQAVECCICKHLHRVDAASYLTIKGSIYIGNSENPLVEAKDEMVVCYNASCIKELIRLGDSPFHRSTQEGQLDGFSAGEVVEVPYEGIASFIDKGRKKDGNKS